MAWAPGWAHFRLGLLVKHSVLDLRISKSCWKYEKTSCNLTDIWSEILFQDHNFFGWCWDFRLFGDILISPNIGGPVVPLHHCWAPSANQFIWSQVMWELGGWPWSRALALLEPPVGSPKFLIVGHHNQHLDIHRGDVVQMIMKDTTVCQMLGHPLTLVCKVNKTCRTFLFDLSEGWQRPELAHNLPPLQQASPKEGTRDRMAWPLVLEFVKTGATECYKSQLPGRCTGCTGSCPVFLHTSGAFEAGSWKTNARSPCVSEPSIFCFIKDLWVICRLEFSIQKDTAILLFVWVFGICFCLVCVYCTKNHGISLRLLFWTSPESCWTNRPVERPVASPRIPRPQEPGNRRRNGRLVEH